MRQEFWSLSRKLNTGPPRYEPAAYYEPLSVRWAAYILRRTETACLQTRTIRRSLNRGVSLPVCLSLWRD